MFYDDFKNQWNKLSNSPNGYLRLSISHPLTFEFGNNGNKKSFIVWNTEKVVNLNSVYAVTVTNQKTSDGKTCFLDFQLEDDAYEEEFLRLCWDMIEASRYSSRPLATLSKRYKSWQRFLSQNISGMSFSSQKGLLGELLFLSEYAASHDYKTAIHGWCGPDGADQDFQFDDTWYEIKTISLSAETVKISSLQQLKQENTGYLTIFVLETTQSETDKVSLNKVVDKIRNDISSEPELEDVFNMRLFKYGYRDSDREEYDTHHFRYVEKRLYMVDSSFPKLTSDNVSSAVVACTYELSLPAISNFRRN